MTAPEIYALMNDLQVQLKRITAFEPPITKPDLEGFTKVVRAQAVPALDSAKVAQALLPSLVAQLPTQLPIKVAVPSKEIVELLSPVVNQQVTAIQASNERLLRELSRYMMVLDATLEKGRQASRETEARFEALVARIPKKVPVDFLQGWRVVLVMTMGPLVVGMLLLAIGGVFSKEPIESYNRVTLNFRKTLAEKAALANQNIQQQQRLSALEKERNAYRDEVLSYRKKFPNAKVPKAKYSAFKGK